MTRTITVLLGYIVLGFTFWFHTPAPQPVKIVPVTAAQIKEGVKNERYQKRVQRATRLAEQVYRRFGCSQSLAGSTGRIAEENMLPANLLAGLVFVESSCNPNAKDGLGSIGLTQVNSKVWGRKNLRDPETNLRIGARILAGYVARFGLIEGLHRYNGYSSVHNHVYVRKVLTAAGMEHALQEQRRPNS